MKNRRVEIVIGMNREQYRKMWLTAYKEFRRGKEEGFSDVEILEALRSGDDPQRLYAQFIEMKLSPRGYDDRP